MDITEFVETSLSDTCTSVWSNYYNNPNNLNAEKTTAIHSSGQWPCAKQNWNYKSAFHQRFISAYSDSRGNVWYVTSAGMCNGHNAINASIGVRPAFYLKSSVRLSGLGTSDSPYELVES